MSKQTQLKTAQPTTPENQGFIAVPLDRISRDVAFWMRGAARLKSAGLTKRTAGLPRLFIQAS